MDESGVDVQVLSLTTPAVQCLDPKPAVELARQANDLIGETVRRWPDRFEGFATLPTPNPDEAARELERAVTTLVYAQYECVFRFPTSCSCAGKCLW